jgi:hypothetical protein
VFPLGNRPVNGETPPVHGILKLSNTQVCPLEQLPRSMAVFGPYLGNGWADLTVFSLIQLGSVGFTKGILDDGTEGGVLTWETVRMHRKSPGPWLTNRMRSDSPRPVSVFGPSLGDDQVDPPFLSSLQLANLWFTRSILDDGAEGRDFRWETARHSGKSPGPCPPNGQSPSPPPKLNSPGPWSVFGQYLDIG